MEDHFEKLGESHPDTCTCGLCELIDALAVVAAQRDMLRDALKGCPADKPQMSDSEFRETFNTWWNTHIRPALEPRG